MSDERRTYTVRELIDVLQGFISSHQIEVYSGCHDCGGAYLEVDLYGDSVQLIGHQFAPEDDDE